LWGEISRKKGLRAKHVEGIKTQERSGLGGQQTVNVKKNREKNSDQKRRGGGKIRIEARKKQWALPVHTGKCVGNGGGVD